MMKHLSSTGSQNLAGLIASLIIATVAVALRAIFRLHAKQKFTISDGFIGLAYLSFLAYFGILLNYIVYGPGPGTFDMTDILTSIETGGPGLEWVTALLKTVYRFEIAFVIGISSTKLSILALYHQIFGISGFFRRINYAMVGLVLVLFVLFLFMFIFQCHPIHEEWDLLNSASHCMSTVHLLFAFEFTNLMVDVAMLAMPPFMVNSLNLPKEKKWSISGILLLGGMVCVLSIIRIAYIWNPDSTSILNNVSGAMLASSLQFAFAILCACLPTYAPLLRLFRWRGKSTRQVSPNWKSSFGTPQGHNGQGDNSQNSGYTHKRLIGSSFDRSHEQSHDSDRNGKSYRNDSVSTRNTAENGMEMV